MRKSWKKRWFVLVGHELKYFRESTEMSPIRSLDLTFCESVALNTGLGKPHCFSVVMPARTYHMFAETAEDAKSWVDAVTAKVVSSINEAEKKQSHSENVGEKVRESTVTTQKKEAKRKRKERKVAATRRRGKQSDNKEEGSEVEKSAKWQQRGAQEGPAKQSHNKEAKREGKREGKRKEANEAATSLVTAHISRAAE